MTGRLTWRGHRVTDLLATVLTASAVEIGLRVATLPTVARLAGAPLDLRSHVSAPGDIHLPIGSLARARTAHAVMRRWPFGDTCLRTALVTGHRVRLLQPRLGIGVRRVGSRVEAHAWLVIGGSAFDPQADSFLPMQPMARR